MCQGAHFGTNLPDSPMKKTYSPPLDLGILRGVEILNAAEIDTFESCEGGKGHAYPEPTIRFFGDQWEGFKALATAMQNNLPVASLRRVWNVTDGEPTGPIWEIVFWRKVL